LHIPEDEKNPESIIMPVQPLSKKDDFYFRDPIPAYKLSRQNTESLFGRQLSDEDKLNPHFLRENSEKDLIHSADFKLHRPTELNLDIIQTSLPLIKSKNSAQENIEFQPFTLISPMAVTPLELFTENKEQKKDFIDNLPNDNIESLEDIFQEDVEKEINKTLFAENNTGKNE